jgi:hypothetical protein
MFGASCLTPRLSRSCYRTGTERGRCCCVATHTCAFCVSRAGRWAAAQILGPEMRQRLPLVCCTHNPQCTLHLENTAGIKTSSGQKSSRSVGKHDERSCFETEISHMSRLSRESYLELKDLFKKYAHNTTQHNTTQHNTTQHNTTQHNTTHETDTRNETEIRHDSLRTHV